MAIKSYNPTSPGRRQGTVVDYRSVITKSKPEKSLLTPLKRSGGRNNKGRTTTRFRGGGHKQRYRIIDFRRDKIGVPAAISDIYTYAPNNAHFTVHVQKLRKKRVRRMTLALAADLQISPPMPDIGFVHRRCCVRSLVSAST